MQIKCGMRSSLCLSLKPLHKLHFNSELENVLTNGRRTMRKTNKRFQHLVFFRLKKKDRQQQKEERSREEDRREGGNQTGPKEFQERLRSLFVCLFWQ